MFQSLFGLSLLACIPVSGKFDSLLQPRNAVAEPISLQPTFWWVGSYGLGWSVFEVEAGTPPQTLQLLPATSQSTIWAVSPEGCIATDPAPCNYNRGYLFQPNVSETYHKIADDAALDYGTVAAADGYNGRAQIGSDNVTLPLVNGSAVVWPSLQNQVIESYTAQYPYNGLLGLGLASTETNDNSKTSILASLRQAGIIPSLSWAYTNGATYAFSGMLEILGSLILGGYDTTRFVPNDITFPLRSNLPGTLLVAISSIYTDLHTNISSNTVLLPNGIYAAIDPLVTELWLPLEACEAFESAFNLTWNETEQLYIMDGETSLALSAKNPNVTISISPTLSSDSFVNIVFPYMAFQQELGPPFVEGHWSLYFPLKRASSQAQYVLGRTFLQEAYIVTDYERSSFSVYQALFPNTSAVDPNIVAINSPQQPSSDLRHDTGAIVGIVIGVVALIALFTVCAFFVMRHRRRTTLKKRQDSMVSSVQRPVELDAMETQKAELPAADMSAELQMPIAELESPMTGTWNTQQSNTHPNILAAEKAAYPAMYDTGTPVEAGPPPYSNAHSPTHLQRSSGVQNGLAELPGSVGRRRFSWESEHESGNS